MINSENIGPNSLDSARQEALARTLLEQKYKDIDGLETAAQARDDELRQKNNLLAHRETELQQRQALTDQLTNQLVLMQSSKFWKLRNTYFKLHLFFLYPTFIPRKIFRRLRTRYIQNTPGPQPKAERGKTSSGPKVSVIVPNYNHVGFLKQRLDSIYKQTYRNFEVILLDDKSSDESRQILTEYFKSHKTITRCAFNAKNSGNVFAQWKKGIQMARGELVWIAESDDYCDENFLEKLVHHFKDESIMLAYAHPVFVNEKGQTFDFSFESYTAELSSEKWTKSYVETAHNEVRSALGIKNTIPNVSGVVFRNIPPTDFDYDSLRQFKVCGDWYFYLSIIRGGRLAYVHETNNYYRFHAKSTASNYLKELGFVKEYEVIAKHVAEHYKVTPGLLARNMRAAKFVWDNQNPSSPRQFYQAYNLSAVKGAQRRRKPNILMGIYGFTTGGGETIPVRLSNKLKDLDYPVTVFESFIEAPSKRTIRGMLDKDIPVIGGSLMEPPKILKDFGIEIIHSHYAFVDEMFAKIKNKNVRQVVTLHGMYEAIPFSIVKDMEPGLRKIDYWVYTANKNLQAFEKFKWFRHSSRIKIINGYAPSSKAGNVSRKRLGLAEDDFVVCLASRSLKEKGWREAIDAVRIANMISKRRIVLLLVGDGPIYDELKPLGDNADYCLLGFRQNVFEYYSVADIGLLPTIFKGESCPMTLIECISAKKPFVSTNVGEIKSMLTLEDGGIAGEILDLKNGRVDVYDLAKVIARFANERQYYQRRLSAAAACSVRFSMDRVAAKYGEVYDEVLGGKDSQK